MININSGNIPQLTEKKIQTKIANDGINTLAETNTPSSKRGRMFMSGDLNHYLLYELGPISDLEDSYANRHTAYLEFISKNGSLGYTQNIVRTGYTIIISDKIEGYDDYVDTTNGYITNTNFINCIKNGIAITNNAGENNEDTSTETFLLKSGIHIFNNGYMESLEGSRYYGAGSLKYSSFSTDIISVLIHPGLYDGSNIDTQKIFIWKDRIPLLYNQNTDNNDYTIPFIQEAYVYIIMHPLSLTDGVSSVNINDINVIQCNFTYESFLYKDLAAIAYKENMEQYLKETDFECSTKDHYNRNSQGLVLISDLGNNLQNVFGLDKEFDFTTLTTSVGFSDEIQSYFFTTIIYNSNPQLTIIGNLDYPDRFIYLNNNDISILPAYQNNYTYLKAINITSNSNSGKYCFKCGLVYRISNIDETIVLSRQIISNNEYYSENNFTTIASISSEDLNPIVEDVSSVGYKYDMVGAIIGSIITIYPTDGYTIKEGLKFRPVYILNDASSTIQYGEEKQYINNSNIISLNDVPGIDKTKIYVSHLTYGTNETSTGNMDNTSNFKHFKDKSIDDIHFEFQYKYDSSNMRLDSIFNLFTKFKFNQTVNFNIPYRDNPVIIPIEYNSSTDMYIEVQFPPATQYNVMYWVVIGDGVGFEYDKTANEATDQMITNISDGVVIAYNGSRTTGNYTCLCYSDGSQGVSINGMSIGDGGAANGYTILLYRNNNDTATYGTDSYSINCKDKFDSNTNWQVINSSVTKIRNIYLQAQYLGTDDPEEKDLGWIKLNFGPTALHPQNQEYFDDLQNGGGGTTIKQDLNLISLTFKTA